METFAVALFGEAEKGELHTAYHCRSLPELERYFGNPPPFSKGLFFAVQTLLYHRDLLFFRVREEGFYLSDYINGLTLLHRENLPFSLSAIAIPGVGDNEIFQATTSFCHIHHSILISSEADLYDYLTIR